VRRKVGQDTKRSFAPRAALALCAALALVGATACVEPPKVAVPTPWGTVRADSETEARDLADLLLELRPRVAALLPDASDRTTEIWLDAALRGSGLTEQSGVAALTNLGAGRIQISGASAGIGVDFLLAHELVHALMGRSWDPLPAVMKEGLCDAIACQLVPTEAPRARALRYFAARFAFGDQELSVAFTEPSFGRRFGARVLVTGAGIQRRSPLTALGVRGHGVHLADDLEDEDVLYGYGLLLVERTVARIGFDGLHALCLQAAAEGREVVPNDWLLWAADLDESDASWRRALADGLRGPELLALTSQLDEGLADALVSSLRYRFPDSSGAEFLERSNTSIGLRGGETEVPLRALPPLADAVRREWDLRPVDPLHPGEARWYADRLGLHLIVLLSGADGGCAVHWLSMGGGDLATAAAAVEPIDDTETNVDSLGVELPGEAALKSTLTFSTQDGRTTLSSSVRGTFEEFRVEVEGVVVADLEWGLNTRVTSAEGWSTIACRLDPSLQVSDAVLFPRDANVIVALRGNDPALGEQRLPLHIPLGR